MFFDYHKFVEVHQWGNADLLIDAIKICEQAKRGVIDTSAIKGMLQKVDPIVPDMDDFGDEISSCALNASAAVYETLQFLLDKDSCHIYNIGIYLTETMDIKIQEDKDLSAVEIDKHPLVVETRIFLLDQTK